MIDSPTEADEQPVQNLAQPLQEATVLLLLALSSHGRFTPRSSASISAYFGLSSVERFELRHPAHTGIDLQEAPG